MPARHQTLRATIAWSYDALTADEQRLLVRLSSLPAAAELELIEQVCANELLASEGVLDLLEQLVTKSLVTTPDVDGETRFGMLVSICPYAAEQLPTRTCWPCGNGTPRRCTRRCSAPTDGRAGYASMRSWRTFLHCETGFVNVASDSGLPGGATRPGPRGVPGPGPGPLLKEEGPGAADGTLRRRPCRGHRRDRGEALIWRDGPSGTFTDRAGTAP